VPCARPQPMKEITIVGGFYRERCRFPPSDEFWGSGGRAAAAIGDLDIDTTLVTAVDAVAERILASIAQSFRFKYSTSPISETISFSYDHGLSPPIIWPPPHTLKPGKLDASGDCVLQFGMLEADVAVKAKTVIYDPQEPFSPRHFQSSERPSRLAYVLNANEARKLGSHENLEEAARRIASGSQADVVVVKRGPSGALILEDGNITTVPAFKTESVWPIGSGDVFAAIFAAEWGLRNVPATRAAEEASLGTAEYVETRVLPIPRSAIESRSSRRPIELRTKSIATDEYDVYLAGPFFNMPQLWIVDEARQVLRGMGLKVFSPYHDVGIGRAKDVAPKDIEALEKSRAVLAFIDGVDTGTVFEAGYARAHAKPVIALAQSTPEEPLKMIAGTGCEVVNDFVSAIYRVVWAAWL
jgi:hypothetical protein